MTNVRPENLEIGGANEAAATAVPCVLMNVFDAVRTLLAVRRFKDQAIPDEVVSRIVEAGRLTASANNRQPWHFVVVRNRDRLRELGKLVKTGPYIADAPLAIAVAYDKASPLAVSDASRAIQSMMLTAWDDGVGSNWTGFRGLDEVAKFLAIPSELDVLAVLPFGYPAQTVGRGVKQRKPLREVASLEQYGQPFE